MSWRAWHVHYHGEQNPLLLEACAPLVAAWHRRGLIKGAFFVRYQLGGPHIRWRLRLADAASFDDLDQELKVVCYDFFSRVPSQDPWPVEKISALNRRLLATDPAAGDDEIVPDHTTRCVEYRPEVERYGGVDLLEASHDLFTLSTACALSALATAPADSGRARLHKLPPLWSQAVGSAEDFAELDRLLRYPPPASWQAFAPIVAKADATFDRQSDAFSGILAGLLERRSGAEDSPETRLAAGAGLLRALVDKESGPQAARSVLGSQLHMTANRLGLMNAEELFLAQLGSRAVRLLAETRPELASTLGGRGRSGASLDRAGRERPAARDELRALAARAFVPS